MCRFFFAVQRVVARRGGAVSCQWVEKTLNSVDYSVKSVEYSVKLVDSRGDPVEYAPNWTESCSRAVCTPKDRLFSGREISFKAEKAVKKLNSITNCAGPISGSTPFLLPAARML